MKKKLFVAGVLFSLGGDIASQEKLSKEIVQPVLDETDDEMAEEEAAMLEAYVPEEVSPVRQWCISHVTGLVVLCMRCSSYMNSLLWKPKKRKKRRKRSRTVKQ